MSPELVEGLFTRSDGSFQFARWGRPLAPVVFGTDDATLDIFKDAIRAVAGLGDLALTDTDPELGVNLPVFVVSDWAELTHVPRLGQLIPELGELLPRLQAADANQYRSFRFDADGAIRLCTILLRNDENLQAASAQTVATAQMAQSMLLWSDTAFAEESPVALLPAGAAIVRPRIAALIRAAYDPVLPHAAQEPALAHRLAARAGLLLGDLGGEAP